MIVFRLLRYKAYVQLISGVHRRIKMRNVCVWSLLHFGTCFVAKELIDSSMKKNSVKHRYIMACLFDF